ncbi:Na+/H+ antiporter subunit E [Kaarinaea lacus]
MVIKKAAQSEYVDKTSVRNLYLTGLRRAGLFTLFWWLLNITDHASWIIGIPCIIVALALSLKYAPPRPWRWRPLQVIRFLPIFFWESMRGGIDVSLRVFRPSLPLQPDVIDYTIVLPSGLPRLLMLNVVSLLPGTLSADLHGDRLTLHILDKNTPIESELRRIENHIADMISMTTKTTVP